MIIVTNRKVSGYKPVWAPFKAFSLLFDNPGESLSPLADHDGLEYMDCRQGDPELSFYRALWDQFHLLEKLRNPYLFCPLPHHSSHVTVWGGISDFNVNKVCRKHRFEAEDVLQGLPDAMLQPSRFFEKGNGEAIGIKIERPIRFIYDRLNDSRDTIVVWLKPADQESEQLFKEIVEQRNALTADFQQRFGLETSNVIYRPHVSLGYFANDVLAETAVPAVKALNECLAQKMEGQILTFSSISLYGMTDMETFMRKQGVQKNEKGADLK